MVDVTRTFGSIINVGKGNDTINMGANSTVTVGDGQDTFNFAAVSGLFGNTINGFDPSKDVIGLTASYFNNYQVNDDGNGNAEISFHSGITFVGSITLVGVHASDVHASNFFQLV